MKFWLATIAGVCAVANAPVQGFFWNLLVYVGAVSITYVLYETSNSK